MWKTLSPVLTPVVLLAVSVSSSQGRDLQDRWSIEDRNRVVAALNSNDAAALSPYLSTIDGRESLDLRGIDLSEMNLAGVWVTGQWKVHLDQARLAGTTLARVDLRGAHFSGVDGKGAEFVDSTSLDFAVMEDCDFRDASFRQISFIGGRLKNVRLEGASLQGVNYFSSIQDDVHYDMGTLRDLSFRSTRLRNVSFYYITGSSLDFSSSEIDGASFDRSSLLDIKLDEASLNNPSFQDVDSKEVSLMGTRWLRPHVSGWNFESLDFRYVIWSQGIHEVGSSRLTGGNVNDDRARLHLLQTKNTYSTLKSLYQKYGYRSVAENFHVLERRVQNQLRASSWARRLDWVANDLTHGYGREPKKLLIAAIGVAAFFFIAYAGLSTTRAKWCLMEIVTIEEKVEDSGGETVSEKKEVEWIRKGSNLSNSKRMLACGALSLKMLFFSAGEFLRIPELLSFLSPREVRFYLRGPARWLCWLEAICGLWLIYLAVRDLVVALGS